MSTREILTLQFGHYSNFVGTHWWNIQESQFSYNPDSPSDINHDVLFREGITGKREVTFTPRLLLVDLKGSLKTLPERGHLYEPAVAAASASDVLFWDETKVDVDEKPPLDKNEFQADLDKAGASIAEKRYALEEEVKVWSDYLYTRFHPRTVNVIKEYQHCNENTPFDAFPLGQNLWKQPEFDEDFSDKLRNYVEECDSFQGFHLLTDVTNAFSGLSASCLEYLQDDYDRKSMLVFPIIPSHFADNDFDTDEDRHQSIINDSIRTLNLTLAFTHYAEHSNLFVPLCTGTKGWRQPGPKREFYHVNYNHELPYHSSAILAAAMDTFTLKHRLKPGEFNLIDLCSDLTAYNRKAAAASVCLPFSLNEGADLMECLDNWEGSLTQCLTPSCSLGTDKMMQHYVLRGVAEGRLKKTGDKARGQRDLPAYRMGSVKEMMEFYLGCNSYASVSSVAVVDKGMVVKVPFPRIFDAAIGIDGNVGVGKGDGCGVPESVPVLAGLHNGSEVGQMIEQLHTDARKIKYGRFHQFSNAGIENDEFVECLDKLFELRENYEDNYLI